MSELNTGLTADQQQAITAELGKLLADSYILKVKTHQFHWNVTGPMFNALHRMFEEQYTNIEEAVDEIAERIRALGAYAPGSFAQYAQLSAIVETQEVPTAVAMVAQLVADHETLVRTARSVFALADEANDQPTADMVTQRMQIHEKFAWMLRSMIAKG